MMLFEEFERLLSWTLHQREPGPTLPFFDDYGVPIPVELGSYRDQPLHLMAVYPRL
jgi:hypothetical protein